MAHRYLTHSVAFVVVAAFAAALICHRAISQQITLAEWVSIFLLQLAVHLLLDCFNVYGVAWAAPFSDQRISLNALYVADPFLLLLVAILAFICSRSRLHPQRWASAGLLLTSLYLTYAMFNKRVVSRIVDKSLMSMAHSKYEYIATPTPFNVWLWYVVVKKENEFLIGYRSVFDREEKMDFVPLSRNDSLLRPYHNRPDVQKLMRFSKGYYAATNHADTLVFSDLRFGQIHGWQHHHSPFAFYYFVTPATADNRAVMQRGRGQGWSLAVVAKMWHRIQGRK